MKEKIKVVIKEVDKPAEIKEISNDYKTFQKTVGGLIDMTPLPGHDDIDIICNDEFLYNGSMANIMMPERDHVLCGSLIFAGFNEEDGSTIGLTDKQVKSVMDYIEENKVFRMDPSMAYYAMQEKKLFKQNSKSKKKEIFAE